MIAFFFLINVSLKLEWNRSSKSTNRYFLLYRDIHPSKMGYRKTNKNEGQGFFFNSSVSDLMEAVLNASLLLIVSKGWSLSGHIIGEVLDESPERSLSFHQKMKKFCSLHGEKKKKNLKMNHAQMNWSQCIQKTDRVHFHFMPTLK